ncbi:hypothetical protein [Bradyrhizobium diazoefficiens]|uniref:hypothetical protein n=1 Tax=Bradyrhizobium diazoefficiens TaxID=1355477 RepID=UPI0004B813DA|nr:hypothetical protein [Bradyrhizobium diazoefficiens]
MTTKFRFPRAGDKFGKMPAPLVPAAPVELKFASTDGEFDEDGRLLLTEPLVPPPRPQATVPPPPPLHKPGTRPPVSFARPPKPPAERPRPSFQTKQTILPDDIPWQ